jgi:hypothetical protein
MKKNVVALLFIIMLFSLPAFGQSAAKNGMIVAPGSLNGMVGVGTGIIGGIEVPFGKFILAELPFTFGIGARASINFSLDRLYVGAVGTLHFSLAALDLDENAAWLGNFDIYGGLGLAILPALGLGGFGGISYYITPNFAVYAEGGNASGIGILFKL